MAGIPKVRSAETTSASRSGTTATIGLSESLGVSVGDTIFVRGVIPIGYNGKHIVTGMSNVAPYSVSFTSRAVGTQTRAGTVYVASYNSSIATTGASGEDGVATVLLDSNPNLAIGDTFSISGMVPSSYNGTWIATDVSEEYPYSVSFMSQETGDQLIAGTFRVSNKPIFDTGDWGLVGTDLGSLPVRSRSSVESVLKGQLQDSQSWGGASNILFGNGTLDTSLPFPVALLKALAQSVMRSSLGSVYSIGDALSAIHDWFDALFVDLRDNPEQVIGSAQNIKMDNQRTFSQFLTEAWKAITKEPGTGKTVDDAVAALSALSDKVGEAYFNATDAQDFQGEIIKAGSNLIKNAGFESKLYEQSVGTFVTEQAHTGSKSLRIIGNGVFTSAYTLLSTDSTPRNITVAPGEIFYAEVYVRGNPNNSQTVGGAGGIRMLFQPYSGTNQALNPSVFALAASTDLNNGWEQLAGFITMPPTAKYLTIKLELTPAVELGEKYYFDDVLVREVTLASAANTAATTAGTTADAAKENLQTTVDGIVQSVDGGSSTGAAHMTVKEKLQNAWSNFWDGLSGNNAATATGKRPIDVFLAGKTARNQADLGVTNAGIADGKVETGITGIHQSITGDSSSGSVTTIKARFQSAWSNLWHGLNGDSSVSTSDKTPGHIFTVGKAARDQANLGVTNAGVADGKVETAVTGIHQSITGDSSSGSVTTIKGRLQEAWSNLWDGLSGNANATATGKRPLDVFLAGKTARVQADLGVTNAGVADGKAAAAKSMLSTKSSLGSNLAVDAGFENTYFNHSLWGGSVITTEQAHSGSRSVKLYGSNTGWNSCDMICDENGKTWIPVSPNDVYYIEFWVLGKTTNNVNAAGNVFLQIDIQNSDGSWNYGGVHASRSNSGTWIKYSGYITAPSNALKMSPTIYLGQNTPSSEIYYVDDVVIREVTEGNVAKTNAQTITDGVYQAVEGGSATNNAHTTVKDRLQAAWSRMWDGLNGSSSTSATGKTPADIFTVGKAARTQADLGVTNAGLAQGTASSASSLATAKAKAGANLTVNGDCEDTSISPIAYGAPASYGFSTEQRHSGTRSYKWVQAASTFNGIWYSFAAGDRQLRTRAGERYYVEAWIFPHASNGTTGNAYFGALCEDSVGGGYTYINAGNDLGGGWASIPRGQWTKVSGYVTVPTGYDRISFYLQAINDVPAGYAFYVDDLVVREVTEASTVIDNIYQAVEGGSGTGNAPGTVKDRLQAAWSRLWDGLNNSSTASSTGKLPSDLFTVGKTARVQADLGVTNAGIADGKAATAQTNVSVLGTKIDTRFASGASNLCPDPSFENANINFGYRSSEKARTGTYSIKLTGDGVNYIGQGLYVNSSNSTVWQKCAAGDVFYGEAWIRAGDSNTQNSGTAGSLTIVFRDSAGTNLGGANIAFTASTAHKGTWTKISNYVTAPANAVETYAYFEVYPALGSGQVYFFDDVIVREVTEGNVAKTNAQTITDGVYQAVEGGSATGNSHATVKSKLQQAWSNVWDGLNNNASPTSSGKLPGDLFTVSQALKQRAENAHGRLDTTNANLFGNSNGGTQIQAAAITPGSIDSGKLASAVNTDISSRLPAATFRSRTRSSQNLIPSPGFEDSTFPRWNYGGALATTGYSTAQKRSGTYSFSWTTPTPGDYRGLLASPNDLDQYFEVNGGDKYYVEGYFYVPSAAGSAGGIEIGASFYNGDTYISGMNPTGGILTIASASKNTWNKLSGYVTVPTNANRMYVWFLSQPANTSNVTYYLDDVILREVTESTGIKQNLFGYDTVQNKLVGDRIPPLDATIISTGQVPEARIADLSQNKVSGLPTALTTNKNLAKSKLSNAANLVSNPGFEYTNFYDAGLLDTTVKRSGSRSLKMTSDGTYFQVMDLFYDDTGIIAIPVSGGDNFYVEAYVLRGGTTPTAGSVYIQSNYFDAAGNEYYADVTPTLLASNISTTNWTKISGYLSVPANAVKYRIALVMDYTINNGTSIYFDDVVVKEYTSTANLNNTIFGQKTLKSELLSSVLPPNIDGSKIQTGSMPQSRVTNLSNDLTSISGTANTAKSVARTISYAGSNLLKNPGFEDTNFFFNPWWGDTALLNDNATYARSGSRSVKLIGRGTSGQFSGLNVSTDTNGLVVIPATAGDTFYMEFWVKASAAYTNLQYLTFRLVGVNASGGETGEYPAVSIRQDQISSTSWTKVSGYVRLSAATTAGFYVQLYVDDLTPTTSSFYVDDLIIREVAHSALINNKLYGSGVYAPQNEIIGAALPPNIDGSKIQTGSMAQDRVTNLPTDLAAKLRSNNFTAYIQGGSNLATNPGLEDSSLFIGWQGVGNQLAFNYNSTYVRTGSASLKMTGVSDTLYHEVVSNPAGTLYLKGNPSQTFYLECWVRGDANNPLTPTSYNTFGIGVWAYSSIDGYIDASVIYVAGTTIGKSGWVKVSGNVTISSDSRINLVRPLIILTANATSAYTYYIDDIVVKEVSEINSVNAQIANALTNTTYAVTGGGFAEALAGLNTTFTNINNAYGKLRALETTKVSATSKGTYTSINFSDYSGDISAAIPAFAVSYPYGSGPSYVAISASTAGWETTSSDRDCKMIYGGTGSTGGSPTATDYQLISGTMFRQPDSGSPTPYFYALARCNAAGTEYVFARMYAISATAFRADVGYKLAGGTEQFLKQGIVLSWDLSMQFEVGTTNGVRTYRIWSKGAVAWDSSWSAANGGVVDSSSAYGQNNRYWGAIAQVRSGKTSGRLTGVSVADNQTPTVNGSTARMARTGGDATLLPANYSANTDVDINAASFFNSAVYQSLDITPDTTNGIFTVTTAGTYAIAARILVTTDTSAWMHVSLVRYTSGAWSLSQRGTSIYANSGGNNALSGEWLQYLAAGDKVKLNIRKSTANGSLITQNASGDTSQSYFSIALLSS